MIRAIGFLAGVGLTVAAFLLVLDTRDNQQAETATEAAGDATAEEIAKVATAIAEQLDVVQADKNSDKGVGPDPEVAPAEAGAQHPFEASLPDTDHRPNMLAESDPAAAPDPEAATAQGEPQSGFDVFGLDPDQQLGVKAEAQGDGADRQDSGDASTYLFWSPFRSEWAAQGFAGRLTSATQVPVEVVNAGPGKYRVAFSYQDETERLARIRRIETITGLKLE